MIFFKYTRCPEGLFLDTDNFDPRANPILQAYLCCLLSSRLKDLLEENIKVYLDESSKCVETSTFLTDDGSGKGAGLVAAIAERIRGKTGA